MTILINDQYHQLDLSTTLPLLPPERQEKAMRFRHDIDRKQCVAAWLLLREGCMKEFDMNEVPPMDFNEHGKPFFPTMPHIHFNLSHCKEAIACAIGKEPVGIDIERIRHAHDDLLHYVLNEKELLQVSESPTPDLVFTQLWTRKESLLKLTGEGLCDSERLKSLFDNHPNVILQTIISPTSKYVYTVAKYRSEE